MSKPIERRFVKAEPDKYYRLAEGQKRHFSTPEKLLLENINRMDISSNSNGLGLHDGERSGSHRFYSGLRSVNYHDQYYYGNWMRYENGGSDPVRSFFVVKIVNDGEFILYTWNKVCPTYPRSQAKKATQFIAGLKYPRPKRRRVKRYSYPRRRPA